MATRRSSTSADRTMDDFGGARATGERPPSEPVRGPQRHRSHAPSPFLSPRSSAIRADKTRSTAFVSRHAREPAPSVEPERARLPGKLHKIEEDAPGGRNSLDAEVLASLFGTDSEDEAEREQHLRRTGQPESLPTLPLHRTRPHLDERYREASHDTTMSDITPVAGPSGLHRPAGQTVSGVVGPASSGDESEGSHSPIRTGRTGRYRDMYNVLSTDDDSDESQMPVPSARKRYIQRDGSASSRKRRHNGRTQRSPDDQVDSFLSGLDLPDPKYRPLSVKARLANELADRTSTLPPRFRVERVSSPSDDDDRDRMRHPDPEDAADGASGSAAGTSVGEGTTAAAAQERAGSPAESLPDYEDQEPPETALRPKYEEVELVAEQPYFEHPTRRGAIERWSGLLATRAQDLPNGFSCEAYLDDLTAVKELERTRPPHGTQPIPIPSGTYVPPRDFQLDPARKLLSLRPSDTVNAALWEKLLSPAHEEDHYRPPGEGRKCTCPLWVPSSRPSFAVELVTLSEKRGLGLADLLDVVEVVFSPPTTCKEPREVLLRKIYESNWLWFAGIEELALIRKLYVKLATNPLIEAVALAIQALFEQERIELKRLELELARHKASSSTDVRGALDLSNRVARQKGEDEDRQAARLSLLDRLRRILEQTAAAPLPSGRDAARAAVEAWRKPVEAPRLPSL